MFPCSRQIQWTQPLRYDLFVWSFGESVPRIKFYPATCRSWTKLLLVISIPATFQPSVIRFLCYVLLRSSSPPLIDLYPSCRLTFFVVIGIIRSRKISISMIPQSRVALFSIDGVGDLWSATPVVVSCYVCAGRNLNERHNKKKNCNCNWKQCTVWIANVTG